MNFMLARAQRLSKQIGIPRSILRNMSSETEESAKAHLDPSTRSAPTIFDKIISKEIPASILYEDDLCLAFKDINPQAPTHFLVIPKNKDGLVGISSAMPRHKEILGHLMFVAQDVALKQGLRKGFRIVINDGEDGLQSVFHLHLHVIGGRKLNWSF